MAFGTNDAAADTLASDKETTNFSSAAMAALIPLSAGLIFAGNDGSDFTAPLSIAGSFSSPVLYGAIPAWIAWNQQQQSMNTKNKQHNSIHSLVPIASLPVLGLLSTGFVGEEMMQRMGELLQTVTTTAAATVATALPL